MPEPLLGYRLGMRLIFWSYLVVIWVGLAYFLVIALREA